jgi:hypothetical protein
MAVADRLLRGGWWDRPGGRRGSRQAGDMGPGRGLGRSRGKVRILGRGDVWKDALEEIAAVSPQVWRLAGWERT